MKAQAFTASLTESLKEKNYIYIAEIAAKIGMFALIPFYILHYKFSSCLYYTVDTMLREE